MSDIDLGDSGGMSLSLMVVMQTRISGKANCLTIAIYGSARGDSLRYKQTS